MKKKGLIISTVVMVVVLIASLTTATYAWFTATSQTAVEDITLRVDSSSDVRMGVSKENAYKATPGVSDFYTGTVEWDTATNKWSDGATAGLGFELNTGLSINFTKAVFTGTGSAIDSDWTATNGLLAANAGDNDTTPGTAAAAIENRGVSGDGDYLHLVLGIAAGKEKLKTITCTITVNLDTNPLPNLGMNAALAYCYKIDGYALNNTGATGKNEQIFKKSNANSTNVTPAKDDGIVTIEIATQEGGIDTTKIYTLDLYIFIDGKDADCVTSATGSACSISISFSAEAVAGD